MDQQCKTKRKDGTRCPRAAQTKGHCGACYQASRRHARGEGNAPGRTRQLAPPGEGDAVRFRLPAAQKNQIKAIAKGRKVEASVLYREAVDEWLTKHAKVRA